MCPDCEEGLDSPKILRHIELIDDEAAEYGIKIVKTSDRLMAKKYGYRKPPGITYFRKGKSINYDGLHLSVFSISSCLYNNNWTINIVIIMHCDFPSLFTQNCRSISNINIHVRMTFSEWLNIKSDFSSKSMLWDFVAHILRGWMLVICHVNIFDNLLCCEQYANLESKLQVVNVNKKWSCSLCVILTVTF